MEHLLNRSDKTEQGSVFLAYFPKIPLNMLPQPVRHRKTDVRSERAVPLLGAAALADLVYEFLGITYRQVERERRKLLEYQRKLNDWSD